MKRVLKWILKTVGEDTLREVILFILNRASDELLEFILDQAEGKKMRSLDEG